MNVPYAKIIVTTLTVLFGLSSVASAQGHQPNNIADVLAYIDRSWDVLTRSPLDCKTVMDARVPEHSTLYLPKNYPEPSSVKELPAKCKITSSRCPK